MTKRRRQGWMLFLAGLLLLAGAWLLLKLLPGLDTTPWRAVPFLCLGVGCGLFGGGTGELLAVQAKRRSTRSSRNRTRLRSGTSATWPSAMPQKPRGTT